MPDLDLIDNLPNEARRVWRALRPLLTAAPAPIRLGDLAAASGVSRPNLVRALAHLVAASVVVRHDAPSRRPQLYSLPQTATEPTKPAKPARRRERTQRAVPDDMTQGELEARGQLRLIAP